MHLGLKKKTTNQNSQSPKMFMKHLPILELASPSLILKSSKEFTHIPALPPSSAAPRASLDPGRWAPNSCIHIHSWETGAWEHYRREQMGQGGAGTRHQAAVPQSISARSTTALGKVRQGAKQGAERHTPSQSFLSSTAARYNQLES